MPYISVSRGGELHFFLTPVLISRCDICISLRLQEIRRIVGGEHEPA